MEEDRAHVVKVLGIPSLTSSQNLLYFHFRLSIFRSRKVSLTLSPVKERTGMVAVRVRGRLSPPRLNPSRLLIPGSRSASSWSLITGGSSLIWLRPWRRFGPWRLL